MAILPQSISSYRNFIRFLSIHSIRFSLSLYCTAVFTGFKIFNLVFYYGERDRRTLKNSFAVVSYFSFLIIL